MNKKRRKHPRYIPEPLIRRYIPSNKDLICPIGVNNPRLCSAGTCLQCSLEYQKEKDKNDPNSKD